MVAVFGSEARVARAIGSYGGEVSLASINGPESVVISGQSKAVQAVVGGLKAEGVKSRRLQVSHAFHSPLMEPMLESFGRVADEVGYSCPKIGLVSNVSGEWADAEVARAEYWCRHARQPVRFAQGMRRLQERGYEVFVKWVRSRRCWGWADVPGWGGGYGWRACVLGARIGSRCWRVWGNCMCEGCGWIGEDLIGIMGVGGWCCRPIHSSDSGIGWRERRARNKPWRPPPARRGCRARS